MSRLPDAWTAARARPWRFLSSPWPWRALAYVLSTIPIGLLWLVVLVVVVGVGLATVVVVAGLLILAGIPQLAHVAAIAERGRLRLVRPDPGPALGSGPRVPLRELLRVQRGLPVSWSEIGHLVLLATLSWLAATAALVLLAVPVILLLAPWLVTIDVVEVVGWHIDTPAESWAAAGAGAVLLVAVLYVITWLACGQAALTQRLLDPPGTRLTEAVAQLRRSRSGLVDAFEAERRRIERDLHDGVQQRLLALTMTLGSAELEVADDPALALIRRAREQAEQALAELRSAVRGIHPRVLSDHGLPAAVHEIADRAPVPVRLDLALTTRLPTAVEAAAYYVVSEALTNVARHAGAARAEIHAWTEPGSLVVTVSDDGRGGADPARGSGLHGLRLRLDALDGTLQVSSPPGGPTLVRMRCPIP